MSVNLAFAVGLREKLQVSAYIATKTVSEDTNIKPDLRWFFRVGVITIQDMGLSVRGDPVGSLAASDARYFFDCHYLSARSQHSWLGFEETDRIGALSCRNHSYPIQYRCHGVALMMPLVLRPPLIFVQSFKNSVVRLLKV